MIRSMTVAGLDETFLDLFFRQLFVQQRPVLSCSQLKLEIHMVIDDGFEAQSLRLAAGHRQHVHAEGVLQAGLLIKHVDEIVHVCAFFRSSRTMRMPSLEDWLEISTISVVTLFSTRLATSFKNLPMLAPDHRVGNLGDDQPVLAALAFFHFDPASQADLADTGLIDRKEVVLIYHNAAGREIRTFDILHQFPCS